MEEIQLQKQLKAIENNKELIRKNKQWKKLLNSEKQKAIKLEYSMPQSRSKLKKLIKDKFYPYTQPLGKGLSYTHEEGMKVLCRIDGVIIYSL